MARLHLTYLPDDPAAPRLAVAVQFVDRKGQVIKTERHELEANEIASSDFGGDEFESAPAIEPGPRVEFRTSVFALLPFCPPGSDGGGGADGPNTDGGGVGVDGPTPPPGTDGGSTGVGGRLIASLELMDRRGHTIVVLNPVALSHLLVLCGDTPGADGGR
jgi:hypothetical protein